MLVFSSFAGTVRFCGLFHSAQPDVLPYEGQLHSGNEWAPRTQHSLLHTREWNASCWRGDRSTCVAQSTPILTPFLLSLPCKLASGTILFSDSFAAKGGLGMWCWPVRYGGSPWEGISFLNTTE